MEIGAKDTALITASGTASPVSGSNVPAHYKMNEIEPIKFIQKVVRNHFTGYEGFCLGNIFKYLMRYKFKGDPVGDLTKAKNYIDYLLEVERENRRSENGPEVL